MDLRNFKGRSLVKGIQIQKVSRKNRIYLQFRHLLFDFRIVWRTPNSKDVLGFRYLVIVSSDFLNNLDSVYIFWQSKQMSCWPQLPPALTESASAARGLFITERLTKSKASCLSSHFSANDEQSQWNNKGKKIFFKVIKDKKSRQNDVKVAKNHIMNSQRQWAKATLQAVY